VSANAGSGKTHVLAQRVINLLLRGVDPAKILCITFTKAAAANMANRVFGTLADWTTLDDAALDKKIALSTGHQADAPQRARARRLFASALETPGGLKVQTIHAFCTRLLHQFPFEANVAAPQRLDEAGERALRTPAWVLSTPPRAGQLSPGAGDGDRRGGRPTFMRWSAKRSARDRSGLDRGAAASRRRSPPRAPASRRRHDGDRAESGRPDLTRVTGFASPRPATPDYPDQSPAAALWHSR
jgi:ATP-dependent helicase/nuclease subunit A